MSRVSNYELIRIVSMVLIVFHHFSLHSGWEFDLNDKSSKKQCVQLLGTGGKVGVNMFMMLTGYFLARESVKVASVVRIWIQVLQYSWGYYAVYSFHLNDITREEMLGAIFPIVRGEYWFVTVYIITVLLSPALGKMALNMSHNEFIGTLMVMFMTMTVMPYLSYSSPAYSDSFWFIFLYLLGSYFKLYEHVYERCKTRTYFVAMVATFIINAMSISFFTTHYSEWIDAYGGIQMLTFSNSAPLSLFMAIFIFLFLGRLEFSSRIVNTLASATLGVYLIHDNMFFGYYLWNDWVRGRDHYHEAGFYIFMIVAPLVVYIICSLVELSRKRLLVECEDWAVEHVTNIVIKAGNYATRIINTNEFQVMDVQSKFV